MRDTYHYDGRVAGSVTWRMDELCMRDQHELFMNSDPNPKEAIEPP